MSSKAKHTPGPWHTFSRIGADGLPEVIIAAANGCPIAAVGNHAEYKENARVIEAAPDLYEALIGAKQELWLAARSKWTMADFKNWALIQEIDAALEKADGLARTGGLSDFQGWNLTRTHLLSNRSQRLKG